MSRRGEMLVVGSVALDSVETPYGESKDALGGSAVFFSLAARFFNPVHLVGVVGSDFPEPFRRLLEERQVDCRGLQTTEGATFRWSGRFGKELREAKTLATHLNVFQHFRPALTEEQKSFPVIFLGNIDPELQSEVLAQMKAPRIVAADTHDYWIKNKRPALKELLSKVDILFMNDEEARKLSRQVSLLKAARTLSSWGPRIVIIKKGEHGANIWAGGKHHSFPAYPIEDVADPTGAGDSFAGGFLGYLSGLGDDWYSLPNLKRALLHGTVMASFNVEDFSTHKLAGLERSAIDERYRAFVELLQIEEPAAVR